MQKRATTKQLPDGRYWVEIKVTEEEYQFLLNRMYELGAPNLAELIHWETMRYIAETKGNPAPPMPWKENKLTLQPVANMPIHPRAMTYSPARRYDTGDTGKRDRLRQMVAVKRQIELELISFAEAELMGRN